MKVLTTTLSCSAAPMVVSQNQTLPSPNSDPDHEGQHSEANLGKGTGEEKQLTSASCALRVLGAYDEEEDKCRSLLAIAARGIAEVNSCLLLGEARGVQAALLAALGVTCVVTAAAELPPLPLGPPVEDSLRLALRDSPGDCIETLFDAVADKVEAVRERGGRTLVHCVAGVSRSAALCLAYLMKYEHMTLRKAFTHLRSKRPAVRPNTGFFRQLISYERRLFGRSSVDMVSIPTGDANHLIPDVYEPDYRRTLLFEQRYGRQLTNGRRC